MGEGWREERKEGTSCEQVASFAQLVFDSRSSHYTHTHVFMIGRSEQILYLATLAVSLELLL